VLAVGDRDAVGVFIWLGGEFKGFPRLECALRASKRVSPENARHYHVILDSHFRNVDLDSRLCDVEQMDNYRAKVDTRVKFSTFPSHDDSTRSGFCCGRNTQAHLTLSLLAKERSLSLGFV
jgi:hypothetical protein